MPYIHQRIAFDVNYEGGVRAAVHDRGALPQALFNAHMSQALAIRSGDEFSNVYASQLADKANRLFRQAAVDRGLAHYGLELKGMIHWIHNNRVMDELRRNLIHDRYNDIGNQISQARERLEKLPVQSALPGTERLANHYKSEIKRLEDIKAGRLDVREELVRMEIERKNRNTQFAQAMFERGRVDQQGVNIIGKNITLNQAIENLAAVEQQGPQTVFKFNDGTQIGVLPSAIELKGGVQLTVPADKESLQAGDLLKDAQGNEWRVDSLSSDGRPSFKIWNASSWKAIPSGRGVQGNVVLNEDLNVKYENGRVTQVLNQPAATDFNSQARLNVEFEISPEGDLALKGTAERQLFPADTRTINDILLENNTRVSEIEAQLKAPGITDSQRGDLTLELEALKKEAGELRSEDVQLHNRAQQIAYEWDRAIEKNNPQEWAWHNSTPERMQEHATHQYTEARKVAEQEMRGLPVVAAATTPIAPVAPVTSVTPVAPAPTPATPINTSIGVNVVFGPNDSNLNVRQGASGWKHSHGSTAELADGSAANWDSFDNQLWKQAKEAGRAQWGEKRIYFRVTPQAGRDLAPVIMRVAESLGIAIAFKVIDEAASGSIYDAADTTTLVANFASEIDAANFAKALAEQSEYTKAEVNNARDNASFNGTEIDSKMVYASGYNESRGALKRIAERFNAGVLSPDGNSFIYEKEGRQLTLDLRTESGKQVYDSMKKFAEQYASTPATDPAFDAAMKGEDAKVEAPKPVVETPVVPAAAPVVPSVSAPLAGDAQAAGTGGSGVGPGVAGSGTGVGGSRAQEQVIKPEGHLQKILNTLNKASGLTLVIPLTVMFLLNMFYTFVLNNGNVSASFQFKFGGIAAAVYASILISRKVLSGILSRQASSSVPSVGIASKDVEGIIAQTKDKDFNVVIKEKGSLSDFYRERAASLASALKGGQWGAAFAEAFFLVFGISAPTVMQKYDKGVFSGANVYYRFTTHSTVAGAGFMAAAVGVFIFNPSMAALVLATLGVIFAGASLVIPLAIRAKGLEDVKMHELLHLLQMSQIHKVLKESGRLVEARGFLDSSYSALEFVHEYDANPKDAAVISEIITRTDKLVKDYLLRKDARAVDAGGVGSIAELRVNLTDAQKALEEARAKAQDLERDLQEAKDRAEQERVDAEDEFGPVTSDLGEAEDRTLDGRFMAFDYDRIIDQVNADVPVVVVSPEGIISRNLGFNDPTTTRDFLNKYIQIAQDVIDSNPQLKERLAQDPKLVSSLFNINTLSEVKLQAAHNIYERGRTEEVGLREVISRQAENVLAGSPASKKEAALAKLRLDKPLARQLDIQGSPSKIVSAKDATRSERNNPDVLVIHQGFVNKAWRPNGNGGIIPGEKLFLAQWRGKTFFLYVSRSHTLGGSQVHQWRSMDAYLMGWFVKSNPENLDDCSPLMSAMLDKALYHSGIRLDDFKSADAGAINKALLDIDQKPLSRRSSILITLENFFAGLFRNIKIGRQRASVESEDIFQEIEESEEPTAQESLKNIEDALSQSRAEVSSLESKVANLNSEISRLESEVKVEAPVPSAEPVAEVKPQEVEAPKPTEETPAQPRAPPADTQVKEVARIAQEIIRAKLAAQRIVQVEARDAEVSRILAELD
ncbi:MAG: hypothetical protein PHP89_06280, partial [Candidatus Omnitrophica bacterium]|nr:hypothetical protein [Candidatus Omnitrophota bacterium]